MDGWKSFDGSLKLTRSLSRHRRFKLISVRTLAAFSSSVHHMLSLLRGRGNVQTTPNNFTTEHVVLAKTIARRRRWVKAVASRLPLIRCELCRTPERR